MTSRQRKWQLKKQELGLCTICGKAAATHKGYCDEHHAASLENARKWYREYEGRERKQQYKLAKKQSAQIPIQTRRIMKEDDLCS